MQRNGIEGRMKNVYTYYEAISSTSPEQLTIPEEGERRLIHLWAETWRRQGWNPVLLNEETARHHPKYAEYKAKFWSLPTINGHEYEGACFMRYVAVAQAMANDGVDRAMLVDYDVINYGFDPAKAVAFGEDRMFSLEGDEPMAGSIIASRQQFEALADIFLEWTPDERDHDWVQAGQSHCSDWTMFVLMHGEQRRPKPAWLEFVPGVCALFPKPGWSESLLTHYGCAMYDHGHRPKWEHIPRLRPLTAPAESRE